MGIDGLKGIKGTSTYCDQGGDVVVECEGVTDTYTEPSILGSVYVSVTPSHSHKINIYVYFIDPFDTASGRGTRDRKGI